jgi:hypothetical protein
MFYVINTVGACLMFGLGLVGSDRVGRILSFTASGLFTTANALKYLGY